ncbi:ATP-binding cassette domain-containing protein [Aurantiacibacter xanthus]|uniref:ATP-binding cassette domain-containing protein n=1 Tax=Aurantiacibacter xanthus TaxID=1784712 RepID=A0A3A1P882_9SPHN|nr:ATP-binding cassette domain-containing protein [Aurantiacibacter xanthus]RIV85482.1 ATP-binding cassette domain-containing protein [Aurantiacibacter xanthus]
MTGRANLLPIVALVRASDRRALLRGVVLSLTTALAGIALLGLSGWFIAATALAGATVASALAFDVFMPSASIRLLAIDRTASRYGERLATHDATLRVLAGLRERLFRGFAQPDAAHGLAANPSRRLFRLTIDIDALDSLYLRVIAPLCAAVGAALAVALALAFVHPLLGLAVGGALLAGGLGIPLWAAKRARTAARRRGHGLEILRSRTIDLVRGQADLAVANRLGAQVRALAAADTRVGEADRALNRTEADTGFGFGIVSAALLAGTLLAAACLAEAQAIGAPIAAFAVLLVLAAFEPFALLRRGAIELGGTLQAASRLGPRLQRPAHQNAPALTREGFPVGLDNVDVLYPGAATPVLSRISLSVRAGERIALVGPSGAGKSTLLALLAGELAATSGQVRTSQFALLTQRTELFRDTLRGNLAVARADASDTEMLDVLAAAGLSDHVTALPEGLCTMLGEGGAGLSAGQARRLALARLLLRAAPLWLLDEPTEGLDGDTARDLLARLHQRAAGRTLVIATHTRREAALADRIIVLRDGRIGADLARGSMAFDTQLKALRPD